MNVRVGSRRAGRGLTLVAWSLALLAGCGQAPAPESADPDAARRTLDRALASWIKGDTVEGLKTASPSLVVGEPKWQRGDKLTKYEVQGPGKPSGAQREFRVKLWLTDAKGKATEETVTYQVGVNPIEVVARPMFD